MKNIKRCEYKLKILEWLVGPFNDFIWTYILIAVLLILGIYFTVRTRFVQVRLFGEMFRLIFEKRENNDGVSPFQAFTISAASRVGTGNVTGVALALGVGGLGAAVYYMLKAFGFRILGIVFSILLTLCFGFIFNAVQSNTISQSFMDVFGLPDWIIGLVLVIFTAIIIFGGVKRIVKVTELVVPIMAIFYLIIAF